MKDSQSSKKQIQEQVVNCFQKLLSSWWRTAKSPKCWHQRQLWIAFKNYYLRDEGQHNKIEGDNYYGCELLSKIIIFVMKDSTGKEIQHFDCVVNCFQKLLSSWWRTAKSIYQSSKTSLWIAFKNYYLRDEGQRSMVANSLRSCCELLSKIIIFVMKDNNFSITNIISIVVNCFQKLLSSWWRTTYVNDKVIPKLLWIAFKNYYLRDEGQRIIKNGWIITCCELLSKIIIFVMKDNFP